MTNLNNGFSVGPKGEGRDGPSTYLAYPEYKDSGVEWLGRIPKHWASLSLKLLAGIVLGKMLTPSDKDGMKLKPYLRAKNIRWLNVDVGDVNKMWFGHEEMSHLRLCKDDLLVSEGGEVGRTAIWRNETPECYIQNSVNRVRLVKGNQKFFLYQFYAAGHWGYFDAIVNRISIAHLTKEKLGDAKFLSVPIEEQTQIATFLDRETKKIDRLLEKQQQLIKLLQEKRQAVISHAVTKGLNPNAKMKDSGVEWLGEIPEHWEIKRYKHALTLFQGAAFKSSEYVADSDVVNIRMGNIKKGGFIDLNHNIKYLPDEYRNSYSKYELKEGDLIIAMTDMSPSLDFLAVPAYMVDLDQSKTYLLNQRVGKLVVNKSFSADYIKYLLLSNELRSQLKEQGLGTVQSNMSSESLYNSFFVAPGLKEQKRITAFLDRKDAKISVLVDKYCEAIQLLKERRTALISAAVTGKIDVRNITMDNTDNVTIEQDVVTA